MVNQNRNRGFAHPILLAVLVVIIAAITWSAIVVHRNNQRHQAAISAERALYARLDTEAQKYIETINAKYPGKITHTKKCNYTSAEIGSGFLGCDVEFRLEYKTPDNPQTLIAFADIAQSSLPWGQGDDVSDQTTKATMYRGNKDQKCNVSYYTIQKNLSIVVDCGGSALAEYYPVTDK